jgi:hypothetical protein
MKKVILNTVLMLSVSAVSAQMSADITTKNPVKLLQGTYTRGKGLEGIQTRYNTIIIDYVAQTVTHNGVVYRILKSDCSINPPAVKVQYGNFWVENLTIYYDESGHYKGHSF